MLENSSLNILYIFFLSDLLVVVSIVYSIVVFFDRRKEDDETAAASTTRICAVGLGVFTSAVRGSLLSPRVVLTSKCKL